MSVITNTCCQLICDVIKNNKHQLRHWYLVNKQINTKLICSVIFISTLNRQGYQHTVFTYLTINSSCSCNFKKDTCLSQAYVICRGLVYAQLFEVWGYCSFCFHCYWLNSKKIRCHCIRGQHWFYNRVKYQIQRGLKLSLFLLKVNEFHLVNNV